MIERPGGEPDRPTVPADPVVRVKKIARQAKWPAIGLVVVFTVLGIVFRRSEQWGDIATWVQAVTTLLALLAAAFAGIVTYDLLKVETNRDRQAALERSLAAAERRRDHASQISFWLMLTGVELEYDETYTPEAPRIHVVSHMVNTSSRPGMSVLMTIGLRTDLWRDADATDGAELEERVIEWSMPAIAPGDQPRKSHVLQVPESVARLAEDYGDDALIGELMFTDAAGIDWTRSYPDGRLVERQSAESADNIHLSLNERDEQRRKRAASD